MLLRAGAELEALCKDARVQRDFEVPDDPSAAPELQGTPLLLAARLDLPEAPQPYVKLDKAGWDAFNSKNGYLQRYLHAYTHTHARANMMLSLMTHGCDAFMICHESCLS